MEAVEPFEQIAWTLEAPMMIVTARASDQMDGCLVGFGTQCSIEPTRFLVCLSRANRTYEIACAAGALVVHVLRDAEHDRSLARLFGEETARETDKLARCRWSPGPHDVPVLAGCDWFAGRVVDQLGLGDHVGFVLDVIDDGSADRADEPCLAYPSTRDLDPGNEPAEAAHREES